MGAGLWVCDFSVAYGQGMRFKRADAGGVETEWGQAYGGATSLQLIVSR